MMRNETCSVALVIALLSPYIALAAYGDAARTIVTPEQSITGARPTTILIKDDPPSAPAQPKSDTPQGDKKDDVATKKKKECDAKESVREKKCAAAGKGSKQEKDEDGSYTCKDGKVVGSDKLTLSTSKKDSKDGKEKAGCVTEGQATKDTKSPACSNEPGARDTTDPNTCKLGTTKMLAVPGMSKARAEKAGIKCYSESSEKQSDGSTLVFVTVCNDPEDQKRLRGLTQTASLTGIVTSDATVADVPPETKKPVRVAALSGMTANDATATAADVKQAPAAVKQTPVATIASRESTELPVQAKTVTPGILTSVRAAADTTPVVGRETGAATTTPISTQQQAISSTSIRAGDYATTIAGQTISASQAQTRAPFDTGAQPIDSSGQPRTQRTPFVAYADRQPPQVQSAGYSPSPQVQRQQATPSLFDRITSFLSPLRSSSEPAIVPPPPQQPVQPWFVKEVAQRQKDEELQKQQLLQLQRAEKGLGVKGQTSDANKGAATKGATTAAASTSTPDDPEALLLSALLRGPSIEDAVKKYEADGGQDKKAPDTQKSTDQKTTTTSVPAVEGKTLAGDDLKKEQLVSAKDTKKAPLDDVQAKQVSRYTDISVSQKVTNNESEKVASKSALLTLLDEKAQKNGAGVQSAQPVLPAKITYSSDAAYQQQIADFKAGVKQVMKQYTTDMPLLPMERDMNASKLAALAEEVGGLGASIDQAHAEALYTIARQLELGAFQVAEGQDQKEIYATLQYAFVSLGSLAQAPAATLSKPPESVTKWSDAHFTTIKEKITTAMEHTKNDKARALYQDALSHVDTAALFKGSNQEYWSSTKDMKEALKSLSLATALDRADSDAVAVEQQKQKEETRKKLLDTKTEDKSLWSNLLNLLGF
jgi:hypothetical protein